MIRGFVTIKDPEKPMSKKGKRVNLMAAITTKPYEKVSIQIKESIILLLLLTE